MKLGTGKGFMKGGVKSWEMKILSMIIGLTSTLNTVNMYCKYVQ